MAGNSALQFQCAFCGEPIEQQGNDPVVLVVTLAETKGEQVLYAHWEHLRSAVDSSVPLLE